MLIFLLLSTVPSTFTAAADLPMYALLLPKDRYGQFCSAQAAMSCIGMIAGNAVSGLFLDWIADYRYIFLWRVMFSTLGLGVLFIVYLGWRRYGGAKHYVAPPVEKDAALRAAVHRLRFRSGA